MTGFHRGKGRDALAQHPEPRSLHSACHTELGQSLWTTEWSSKYPLSMLLRHEL